MSKKPQHAQKSKAKPEPTQAEIEHSVRAVCRRFEAAIPAAAASAGHYENKSEHVYSVPDGTYRVDGSAWLLTFADGRWTEAARAMPPEYGGADVIAVPTA